MLTMKCIIAKKYPLSHKLTEKDKDNLLEENKNNSYSYYCLLKEMLCYNPTVEELLKGWSGINLFKL